MGKVGHYSPITYIVNKSIAYWDLYFIIWITIISWYIMPNIY